MPRQTNSLARLRADLRRMRGNARKSHELKQV